MTPNHSLPKHHLELLAPARDLAIGKEAVLHGADAVYIGGPWFGARAKAENSIADIAELVKFSHKYRSKIFVTHNTILAEDELEPAAQLVRECWNAGVDALIVQDMALLEMDLPPIALHASTQCDIRTVEKAKFLSHVGFSQLVLAREMSLQDIAATRAAANPDVTLEFFIHGALCVAFSGNCYISYAHSGRSANRGTCAQECRLPYTLKDQNGGVVAFDQHLLSVKDNDQSANLRALIDAGVRSFKIEGRYKDMGYVKNVTAHYRRLFDVILNERPELARASDGACTFTFSPQVEKTFNRGSTDYFANGRKEDIGAFEAVTYFGAHLGVVTRVDAKSFDVETSQTMQNGDGLAYLHKREVFGLQADVVRAGAPGVYTVFPQKPIAEYAGLKTGVAIHRNRDQAWDAVLAKPSSSRKVNVTLALAEGQDGKITVHAQFMAGDDPIIGSADRAGPFDMAKEADTANESVRTQFSKLGASMFEAATVQIGWNGPPKFVPVSVLNALRREAIEALEQSRAQFHNEHRPQRIAATEPPAQFPSTSLSYLANVYNSLARGFYQKHGVSLIAKAYEAHEEPGEVPLMVTKHCLRFSFNLCPKQAKGVTGVQGQVRAEPMVLESDGETLTLKFDCKPCEMHVVGAMRSNILKSLPPSRARVEPLTFFKARPTT